MKIPVHNLYYMLCYAWDQLEEGNRISVGQDNFDNTTNLFAKLLISSLKHLQRTGFWKAYRTEQQEISAIRGKLLISPSLKKNVFLQGRAICEVDEFGINIMANQIIKATLRNLLKADDLDARYEDDLHIFLETLASVDDIKIHGRQFSQITISRHNRFYSFLMSLCEMIHDSWLPDPHAKGKFQMRELFQDETRMRRIFQDFIKNFYAQEQTQFPKVTGEHLYWDAVALTDGGLDYLPRMETDVSLIGPNRTMIIDTKYYAQALTEGRHGKKTVQSEHLYQLTSYLTHKALKVDHRPEGMLLYPANGKSLRLQYEIGGFKVSICTVDLSKPWSDIHSELINLLKVELDRSPTSEIAS